MPTPRNGSPNGRAPASPLLSRNVEAVAQLEATDRARQTSAERLSDAIAGMAGTGWFAGLHVVWFAAWIAWNAGLVLGWQPIDPFPFSFVHRYLRPLLERVRTREIEPSFIVSHRLPLSRAPEAYRMWNDKTDDCTKIVLDPAA